MQATALIRFDFFFIFISEMSGSKEKKKKVGKKVAPIASAAAVDQDDEKQTRAARFTESETDLLLDLWMNSALSSAQTNKLSPYGRLQTFEDIARIFNQSPLISQVFPNFGYGFGLFVSLFLFYLLPGTFGGGAETSCQQCT